LLASVLGLAQDLSAARAWYLRAAQSGNRNAMRNLALMQARGDGGARSYLAALAWAMLANNAATDVAEALKEVMSPEAQAQASALAKTCLDMPVPPICE
jgi:TPR repeat protein